MTTLSRVVWHLSSSSPVSTWMNSQITWVKSRTHRTPRSTSAPSPTKARIGERVAGLMGLGCLSRETPHSLGLWLKCTGRSRKSVSLIWTKCYRLKSCKLRQKCIQSPQTSPKIWIKMSRHLKISKNILRLNKLNKARQKTRIVWAQIFMIQMPIEKLQKDWISQMIQTRTEPSMTLVLHQSNSSRRHPTHMRWVCQMKRRHLWGLSWKFPPKLSAHLKTTNRSGIS